MKRMLWLWLWPALALVVAAAQEPTPPDDEPDQRESAVREALTGFWDGFIGQDADTFRDQIDFPLTFIEQSNEGKAGSRFVFEANDWPQLARLFSHPMARDEADYEIQRLRLEWLGDETCLALYDFRATIREHEFGGPYMSVLVWRDGWRVAICSIPM